MRPPSIVTFERLYFAGIVVWIVDKLAFWSVTQRTVTQSPQFAANPQLAAMVGPIAAVMTLVYAAVSIGLWYAVARRGSVVAKWIVVVTEALGVLFALGTLTRWANGGVLNPLDTGLALLSTVLAVVAAAFLFRRDTVPWFAPDRAYDEEPLA